MKVDGIIQDAATVAVNETAKKAIAHACARGIEAGLEGVLVLGFKRHPDNPEIFFSAIGSAIDDSIVGLGGIRREIKHARSRLSPLLPPSSKMEFTSASKMLEGDKLEDAVREEKATFGGN
jgi:hypothetical protein